MYRMVMNARVEEVCFVFLVVLPKQLGSNLNATKKTGADGSLF